jgi:hypothetical protein
MSTKVAGLSVFAGLSVLVAICVFVAGWHNFDSEVRLRKEIVANSNTNEAAFDTMTKIIKQKVQIASVGQEQIKDIMESGVKGRTGGALFKSVQEQYPDPEKAVVLWKDLSATIEAERRTFFRRQEKIQDLVAVRESLINGFMSRKFLGLFGGDITPMTRKGYPESLGMPPEYQYIFITSAATKRAGDTGTEDDIDLGLKKGTIK